MTLSLQVICHSLEMPAGDASQSGVMMAHAEHVVLADLLGSLPALIESNVYTCQSSKFMITAFVE